MSNLRTRIIRPVLVITLSIICDHCIAHQELLDLLRNKGVITEEEYQQLMETEDDSVEVEFNEGLKIHSDDRKFEMTIGGRIYVDAAVSNKDRSELGDGTEVRSTRLDISGTFFDHWNFHGAYDFADNAVNVKDAWIGYDGFDSFKLKIGQFKESFSLEEMTSSRYLTFMERGLPNVFAPGRNIGVGLQSRGDQYSLTFGFFGDNIDNSPPEDDEGHGTSGRFTIAPVNDGDRIIHLGIAGLYREPNSENNTINIRQRPESHLSNKRLVDSGNIASVEDYMNWGLESAVVCGPFSLQAEYISSHIDRRQGSNLRFDGGYVFGSWFATGESRKYNAKSGKFGRVSPIANAGDSGGKGAWELGVRYSWLSLNDKDIRGGKEDNITLGLNWYINPHVRFMTNYIIVDSEQDGVDDDPRILQLRAQFDF